MRRKLLVAVLLASCTAGLAQAADKPKLTLDEFFNSVSFDAVTLSPDGRAAVIAAERADWNQNIFRAELWLYREGSGLSELTHSGYDSDAQWSPDGKWIAFLSDRQNAKGGNSCEDDPKSADVYQLFLISAEGGESFAVTQGGEKVHGFSWSADSRTIYYATRTPWEKQQKEAYEKDWKDVCQYRASERGDTIFALEVADAVGRRAREGSGESAEAEKDSDFTPGAKAVTSSPWRIRQLVTSPEGSRLAFASESISERQEKVEEFELYVVDVAGGQGARQLTHNEAAEEDLRWSADGSHVLFRVEYGNVNGPYSDFQTRLYWADAESGKIEQWNKDFAGEVIHYAVSGRGVIFSGREGTEVGLYSAAKPGDAAVKLRGWTGTYELIAASAHSSRIGFVHSTLEKPTEVYLAESAEKLQGAVAVTAFNQLFSERDLPKGKPYRWKADDGTAVEGMLMYPPGKFEAKGLPMFVLIHGGPNDADGNHFEADWYQWDRLAATAGWLVFEPNYRGSTGYGDKFYMGIVPEIVSRPGNDILEGVDALVKDGIADGGRLTVGGYSYGGYMTNWLITQTTRFKAAVTGAGAVEHVANWGNDDTTFDDAYVLGGLPWKAAQRYHDEAAIYYMEKVRTPTHMVAGEDDVRVAVAEDRLLDHALHTLGIPSTLLIFPGEGHSLDQNPWHGKIKVREELKWLQKYGGVGADGH